MKPLAETGPNAEQIRYWNEQGGPRWIENADRIDAHIEPLGRLALERAGIAPGQRVLDVGCGCGQTSLELAERVGPTGQVTGIDLSAGMLAVAARRARESRLANLRFELADAQTEALAEGSFDRIFSRFGVMFFADPVAAFANLRRSLGDGGRLAFVCWQELRRNAWVLEPLAAAAKHVALPPPAAPGEPGPFSLGDAQHLRGVLEAAGFARVELEGVETELRIGGGVEEAAGFLLEVGPTARVLEGASPSVREAVAGAVREVVAAHATAEGVGMGCAVWIAVAR